MTESWFLSYARAWGEFLATPQGKEWAERDYQAKKAACKTVRDIKHGPTKVGTFIRVYSEKMSEGD